MDDAITTKEDFDWFIRDLARKITHVSQSDTGIGSNAEIGTLQADTTRKRSMTMSWFPVRYMLQCRYLYKVSYSHISWMATYLLGHKILLRHWSLFSFHLRVMSSL